MSTERASLISALRRYSSMPPTMTPVVATLPPPVRAARMMKTVRQTAARLARRLPRHVDLEDLVGAGALGLADAFSRRNGMPGSEFEAFASFRVRGAMMDELRRLDAMPRRSRARANEMAKASRVVEQRSGAAAKEEDVAKELGLAMPAYQEMRAKLEASRGPIHLAPHANDDDDESVQEIADTKAETPDFLVARAQIGELVVEGINTLPERMRRVLVGLYVEGQTLKEIGTSLGVSESRVCQIHTEAIGILRAKLEDGEDFAAPASGVYAHSNGKMIRAQERAPLRRTARA